MQETGRIRSHDRLMANLEEQMDSLDVNGKCRAISYLKYFILNKCREDGIPPDAMPLHYPREYILIFRLARSMTFSEAYEELQASVLHGLKKVIDEAGLGRLSPHWRRAAFHKRRDLVETVQAAHAHLQSQKGPVDVRAAPVKWEEKSNGRAIGQTTGSVTEHPDSYFIEMLKPREVLRSMESALETMVHEQQHIMQLSLAHAFHVNALPPDSPYAADAEILHGIFYNDAVLPPEFGQAYRAMPQERDAQAQDIAVRELFNESAKRGQNLLAAGALVLTAAAGLLLRR